MSLFYQRYAYRGEQPIDLDTKCRSFNKGIQTGGGVGEGWGLNMALNAVLSSIYANKGEQSPDVDVKCHSLSSRYVNSGEQSLNLTNECYYFTKGIQTGENSFYALTLNEQDLLFHQEYADTGVS